MGTNFGDYNGDGWLDIVVTNFAHDLNTVYKNLSGKFFIDDSMLAGLGVTHLNLSWGVGFIDFDHDGDLDLFVANGHIYPQVDDFDLGTHFKQTNHLFVNNGGRLKESSASMGPGFAIARSFRSAAFGDYDNDGDVDIFLTTLNDVPLLLRNDTAQGGHWLQVRLIGSESNRDAVGARVTVTAGGRQQVGERIAGGSYLATHDPRLNFGLGGATTVERVQIRWPSGRVQLFDDLALDRVYFVKEDASRPDPLSSRKFELPD